MAGGCLERGAGLPWGAMAETREVREQRECKLQPCQKKSPLAVPGGPTWGPTWFKRGFWSGATFFVSDAFVGVETNQTSMRTMKRQIKIHLKLWITVGSWILDSLACRSGVLRQLSEGVLHVLRSTPIIGFPHRLMQEKNICRRKSEIEFEKFLWSPVIPRKWWLASARPARDQGEELLWILHTMGFIFQLVPHTANIWVFRLSAPVMGEHFMKSHSGWFHCRAEFLISCLWRRQQINDELHPNEQVWCFFSLTGTLLLWKVSSYFDVVCSLGLIYSCFMLDSFVPVEGEPGVLQSLLFLDVSRRLFFCFRQLFSLQAKLCDEGFNKN